MFHSAMFLLAAASSTSTAQPIRHLVYTFQVGIKEDQTQHMSGFGNPATDASGVKDYLSEVADQGRITVDVIAVRQDTGLAVRISEAAKNERSKAPTTCIIYGNGQSECDQGHGGLNEEEAALLQLLGRNFVNRAEIDNKNHWRYAAAGANFQQTSDYTIGTQTNDLLDITFARTLEVKGSSPFTSYTQGKLSYNEKMSVPVMDSEQTIIRRSIDLGRHIRTDENITLQLATDSMQPQAYP